MSRITTLLVAALVTLYFLSSVQAGSIIRSATLFETLTIEGVSLTTPPREAFTILYTNGYSAGGMTAYEEWTQGSLNLVRGDYGGPEGQSSITLGRADGRLVLITQSLNRRGINVGEEISTVQSHFGIAADEQDCRLNTAGTGGSCEVRDAEEGAAATMLFSMTALPTMILRSISRPQELAKTLE